ncbi:type II toxin-antitoxin system RelE family toxin [Nitrosococcus wardiae]|uniref:type II toxin-antitoxin system RelE family toxin n=1 Tax=Nitrosococcus wardiae TaxID=1814290 RepID=UPI001F0F42C4|nr:type II toxin-antitoxin system RelE/ParE family toxin [Nitrosococcus wardiae]
MAWRIELSGLAQKNLHGLDKQIAERILRFLNDRIAKLDDPRSIGDPLKGAKLGEFWKYRVGDYRIIAEDKIWPLYDPFTRPFLLSNSMMAQ